METESVYSLIKVLLEYIKQNDKEEALFTVLDLLMEDGDIDLNDLKSYAENDEEECIVKCINKYIKENELYEEDEDEEW